MMSLLAPFFVNTYPINQNTESALLFEDADVKTIADTYTSLVNRTKFCGQSNCSLDVISTPQTCLRVEKSYNR